VRLFTLVKHRTQGLTVDPAASAHH
jgi:hypothetical protein